MSFPSQTKYIVGNEACERFSFYGMRSILTLYMTHMLLMSDQEAMEIAHLFNAGIYILPLLGAWIADRFLGRYKTILFISLFYCVGHAVLAAADWVSTVEARQLILFIGLFIIAMGAGGIKPCVSAFVGDQVEGQRDSSIMTRVYAAFYWSINLGSFFSFLVIPWVRQNWGYSWAFGIPGIFMGIATFIFWCGRKQYRHKAPAQPHFLPALFTRLFGGRERAVSRYGAETVQQSLDTAFNIFAFIVIAPLVILLGQQTQSGAIRLAQLSGASETSASLCGLCALLLYIAAGIIAALRLAAALGARGFFGLMGSMLFDNAADCAARHSEEERRGAHNLLRVLIVFAMIIPFWSLFDQTMTSWVLQGEKMQAITLNTSWCRFAFGAEEMQSFNPLLVMIFVPVMTLLVYPRIGRWSSPLKRMGIGIVLAGISYGVVAALQQMIDNGAQLSIMWQGVPYLMLTLSEILVSTTGLEYAYTAAGQNMKSLVSSFWFLTSTLGNFLVIYLTSIVSDPASVSTFLLYGALAVAIGLLFLFVTTRRYFTEGMDK